MTDREIGGILYIIASLLLVGGAAVGLGWAAALMVAGGMILIIAIGAARTP